ncbi:MAG TPA: hypothetical protein PLF19_15435 [Ottowia sp.]|jgi:hypothetical protein|uniref:hypothetical protein n=1 Tax=Ottowia sp. TaxID=1898956 RepID=UPI001B4646F8|nr:hypothetical protein [Ottowia sp.]MBP7455726.1 hypothetical protein [Ottowia sp.]MBP7458986.1 hypothetical protein [Ottowia sp.]MBP8861528.1 hypothetical protein [Ottowia sp.]MBP8894741.1 hypothetical protein [Ottowia sp.]MBP9671813.1 hypothetical protein [Ottowia sp.]
MSLITGAAHATTALRAAERQAPDPEPPRKARPKAKSPTQARRTRAKPARLRLSGAA